MAKLNVLIKVWRKSHLSCFQCDSIYLSIIKLRVHKNSQTWISRSWFSYSSSFRMFHKKEAGEHNKREFLPEMLVSSCSCPEAHILMRIYAIIPASCVSPLPEKELEWLLSAHSYRYMYVLYIRIEWVAMCKATTGTRLYRRLMTMRIAISGSRLHYPVSGILFREWCSQRSQHRYIDLSSRPVDWPALDQCTSGKFSNASYASSSA